MYYEEDYYEPSATDEILIEYQQKMKDILLGSIKEEIENIKSENIKLKEENNILSQKVNEIDSKERELEHKKSNLLWEVRRERLSELMKDFQIIMYQAYSIYEDLPKCDNCDENREIKFISPLGNEMKESCTCNKRKTVYITREHICTEFKVNRDGKSLAAWYKVNSDKDYDWYGYESNDYLETVYNENMNYIDLSRHKTFFKSKEECQKYCDWLNDNKSEIVSGGAKTPKCR